MSSQSSCIGKCEINMIWNENGCFFETKGGIGIFTAVNWPILTLSIFYSILNFVQLFASFCLVKKKQQVTYFCLRFRCAFPDSHSSGPLKMSANMGVQFLNMLYETAKLPSSRLIFRLKSSGTFAMSDHFVILLKNCVKLVTEKNVTRGTDTKHGILNN